MTGGRSLTQAMGGRWHGTHGMAHCPCHEDRTPSLQITDGDCGYVILHCFAGCDWRYVKGELQRQGLLDREQHRETGPSLDQLSRRHENRGIDAPISDDRQRRIDAAHRIYSVAAPLKDNSSARYLQSRGLTPPWPDDLRHFTDLMHSPTGQRFDALVAAVRNSRSEITAVHRTFLKADGRGKANLSSNKMALGPLGDGAVRLGPAGKVQAICEGIETGLSVMQLFGVPVWVALGSRLDRVAIPPEVVEVQIFRDIGAPGAEAAEKARARLEREGKRVFVRPPPDGFGDWNDFVMAGGVP